jgi:hypothetical protein
MIERLDVNRDRVVQSKASVGATHKKNSKNRAVKTNDLSADLDAR